MRKEHLIVGNLYTADATMRDGWARQMDGYACVTIEKGAVFKYLGTCGQYAQPGFEIVECHTRKSGVRHSGTFRLENCGCISSVTEIEPVTRAAKADAIEVELNAKEERIAELVTEMAALKTAIAAGERQIDMLRKYDSDDEALAATFARILKTGGSESEILDILKEFGVTNKL